MKPGLLKNIEYCI